MYFNLKVIFNQSNVIINHRHVLKLTLHNGVWALLDFGELTPRTPDGYYVNGYFTESPPNPYQRARGISRVLTYHGPGLLWNHNDTLDTKAAPRPVKEQPAASVAEHGHYYTWPTKVVLVPNHPAEQGHATAEDFLQALEADLAAGPANAAAAAAAPGQALAVPGMAPGQQAVPALVNAPAMVPAPLPVFVPAMLPAQVPAVVLATPKKAMKNNRSKAAAATPKLGQVPLVEEPETSGPSNFAATFNPPPRDDEVLRSESPVESEPVIRRRTKKPKKYDMEDDVEPLASASSPSAPIFSDSDGTPAAVLDFEASPSQASVFSPTSVAFTSPSILRRKKAPATKKKTTINKKLTFETPVDPPLGVATAAPFDIKSLFETEAVEGDEEEEEESEELKHARRLLKKVKKQNKASKARLTKLRKNAEIIEVHDSGSEDIEF